MADEAVVRELLARVPALYERRPADALLATSMAMVIAATLDPQEFWAEYVPMVRGEALRDHAFVLMLHGRPVEALAFVGRAGRTFAQIVPMSFHLAHLALAEAAVFSALHRREEVPELLHRAKRIYLGDGQQRKVEEICLAEPALVAEAPDAEAMRDAVLRLFKLRG